jgi:octaprenyl-diphosphate synthase
LDAGTYFEIIRRKTASLCGTCCRVAAQLSGGDEQVVAHLYDYGENLGIAFQIVDDLLDLLGDQETVGKTLGRDLQKGKLTLPMIRFFESADDATRNAMLSLLESIEIDQDDEIFDNIGRKICEMLTAGDAIEYSRRAAEGLVASAKTKLNDLSPSPSVQLLNTMADAVLTRNS